MSQMVSRDETERAFPGGVRREVAPAAWFERATVAVVFGLALVVWLGWATGIEQLTRVVASWPQMTPWSALCLAMLGAAIALQTGSPPRARGWAGCGLAVLASVLAVVFLVEYATGRSFGLDQLWFGESVRTYQSSWPGRPSPRTGWSVLLLSAAVTLMRVDRRWVKPAWPLLLVSAAVLPLLSTVGYLFEALVLVDITGSTGMGISTALSLLLLVTAALVARPDRQPLAWLLARPDCRALFRLVGILAGLPLLVGLLRFALLALGVGDDAAWALSITVGAAVIGAAAFYLSQHEQRLLIEKEALASQRAEAEKRYRILADNTVDIVIHLQGAIVHLHGTEIAWISPSVQAAFGDPPQQWIGSDFAHRIHAEDLDTLTTVLNQITPADPGLARFRVRAADGGYHWVECHAKPYLDEERNIDGVIAALRIVDKQVETERQLEQLARFDTLTGLVNRAEAISRLQTALMCAREPGPHLGVLFCDIHHFKAVNDTWGHNAGDVVLSTLAARIRACVRQGDTVGRTGGDEMLVLLPGLHNLDEATQIAESIRSRCAEPIDLAGKAIRATLSIGATIAAPGESIVTMTSRADTAMYQAKNAGRNTVTRIQPN